MGYIKVRVVFPCKLDVAYEGKGWDLNSEFNGDKISCPLHGKKCKRANR